METKICIASPECQRLDAILGTRLLPGCPEDPAQDGRQGHGTPSECDNASMLKSLPRSLGSSFATLALCAYPSGSSLVGAGFAHLRVFPLPDCQSRAGTGPGPRHYRSHAGAGLEAAVPGISSAPPLAPPQHLNEARPPAAGPAPGLGLLLAGPLSGSRGPLRMRRWLQTTTA